MRLACIGLGLAFAACGNAAAPPAPGSGSGSSAALPDAVLAAWKIGGLDVAAFTPATTPIGTSCTSGTVSKVDVLVCTYASTDDAKHAVDAGLAWIGGTTGSSQARGTHLIVAADRHKADPNGKTINQLFKLAPP